MKELGADPVFEPSEVAVEGRHAHVQLRRGRGQGPRPGNGEKEAEVVPAMHFSPDENKSAKFQILFP